MGLGGLAFQSLLMLLVVWGQGTLADESLRIAAFSVALVSLGVFAGFVFVLTPSLARLPGVRKLSSLPALRHLSSLGNAIAAFRRDFRYLFSCIAMTIVSQVLWIGSVAFTGMSLDLAVHWSHYFLYVPLIFIIASVPLSPGGLGIFEQLFLLCFVEAANPSKVLALAVLSRLIVMGCSLPGLAVIVTEPKLQRAAAMEAKLKADLSPN